MDLRSPVSLGALARRLHGAVWLAAGLALLGAAASVSLGLVPMRTWPVPESAAAIPAPLVAAVRAVLDATGAAATYTLVFFCGCVARRVGGTRSAGAAGAVEAGGAAGSAQAAGAGAAAPLLSWTHPLGAAVAILAVAHAEHRLAGAGLLRDLVPFGVEPGGYWGSYLAHHLTGHLPLVGAVSASAVAFVLGVVLAVEPRRGGRTAVTRRAARSEPAQPSPAADPAPVRDHAPIAPPAAPSAVADPRASATTVPLLQAGGVAKGDRGREDSLATPQELRQPALTPPAPVACVERSAPRPAGSARRRAPSDPHGLPSLELLEARSPRPAEEGDRETEAQAETLARVLRDFRVDARVLGASRGPNVTLYEVAPAPGVKVQRIVGLQDDIQLALHAPSVRVVAPIPGRGTVGIEIPNRAQDVVRLRELIEAENHSKKGLEIPLFLGRDASGRPLVGDLTRMPHLLIAGATGSGKSICMNAIICSILTTRTFREVKLLMIDPKMVELSLYRKIPHLLAPVVTDMRRAPSVLTWAVQKMEERYALLSRASVRHLKSYNALGREQLAERLGLEGAPELDARKIPFHMAYIVCVIDEFADLMCAARKEVEGQIIRLAQKSRAVGIHLILATQRPTADVITGLIKSNLPCRMAFQVASKVDSRTIIDMNGAETLLGHGDMLYLPPRTSHLVRAQGTYVSDEEVKAICRHVREQAAPEYAGELTGQKPGTSAKKDELFDKAVRVVLETKRGSASLLQRRLGIGYSRASRLIDLMTDDQILGPYKGSKARELLVTLEEWDAAHAGRSEERAR